MDLVTADKLLMSTRSVRRRLDFTRSVEPEVIERCIHIALQAPTGGNSQGWHFVVVTDSLKRSDIAEWYRRAWHVYAASPDSGRPRIGEEDPRFEQQKRIISSAAYLAEHLHEAPVLIIGCVAGRVENAGPLAQASLYGSVLPACWSLMLALRARGVGAAWTTLHIMFEKEVAKILAIPDDITQAVLLAAGYYKGAEFKPAERLPAASRTHWNSWGTHR